jgi:hypothetical protein
MDARNQQQPPEHRQPDPRRAALVGMLVALLLVIVGLILVKKLGDAGQLQDCVMSGRTKRAHRYGATGALMNTRPETWVTHSRRRGSTR